MKMYLDKFPEIAVLIRPHTLDLYETLRLLETANLSMEKFRIIQKCLREYGISVMCSEYSLRRKIDSLSVKTPVLFEKIELWENILKSGK